MATTIQVTEDTLEFLKQLREQLDLPSYDALIKELIQKKMQQEKSLWAKGGKMSMKQILVDLRDKNDRY